MNFLENITFRRKRTHSPVGLAFNPAKIPRRIFIVGIFGGGGITTSYSSGYPARVTAWLLIRHQPNQPSGATKAPHPHGVERPAATSKSLNHYSLCWRDSTSCSRERISFVKCTNDMRYKSSDIVTQLKVWWKCP
ncbi:hypothetical protein ACJJTC_005000 [Scirpophaga incertulas]